jgi:serine-type D-Ala-D-Ala carboxypeptidase/endopeptidase (penicillin-binding protein 4)
MLPAATKATAAIKATAAAAKLTAAGEWTMRKADVTVITGTLICCLFLAPAGECRADGLRALQNEVAGVLAHPVLRAAEVGVLVVSIDHGDVIYQLNADRPLMPASNMKLGTVATALELLGAGQEFGHPRGETVGGLAPRILKPSDNALADALLEGLPAAAGRSDLTPSQLCAEAWGERGVYLRGTRWADGSGLSRAGLMSAAVIVGLLEAMDRSRWREEFSAALPVAGVDGTLRERLREGRARGRVRAKTGTLTGVSALSGYAQTVGGERLIFAMVMNGFDCDVQRVRRIQDRVCEALVGLEREAACFDRAAGD